MIIGHQVRRHSEGTLRSDAEFGQVHSGCWASKISPASSTRRIMGDWVYNSMKRRKCKVSRASSGTPTPNEAVGRASAERALRA